MNKDIGLWTNTKSPRLRSPAQLTKAIAAGADVNAHNGNALMFAIQMGTADQVKALLDGGASLSNQPGYDQPFDKSISLITASLIGRGSAAKLRHLKDAGLDLAHQDANGWSGLGHVGHAYDRRACDFEGYDVLSSDLSSAINVLLDSGADSGFTARDGQNVLHHFARVGVEPDVLERVIELGADVNAADYFQGLTPLFFANNPDVAMCLLEHGADPTHKDMRGNTPARSPYARGAAEILEFAAKRHSLAQIATTHRPDQVLATPEQVLSGRQTGSENVMAGSDDANDAAIERHQRTQQAMSGQLPDGGTTHAQEQRRKYGRAM